MNKTQDMMKNIVYKILKIEIVVLTDIRDALST